MRPNLKLVVTGGVARAESYELVGPIAEASLAALNLDIVFLGTDGIDAHAGLTTHHEIEARTNLALIERARRVVVVADSTRSARWPSPGSASSIECMSLITDTEADPRAVTALRDAGVIVTTV